MRRALLHLWLRGLLGLWRRLLWPLCGPGMLRKMLCLHGLLRKLLLDLLLDGSLLSGNLLLWGWRS